MVMQRRDFIKTSVSAGAVAAISGPIHIMAKSKLAGDIIGHGDFKYRVNRDWGVLNSAQYPVNNCHEMVMDSKKRLIMITDEPKNNIIIYDRSGKLLDTWGHQFPGGHGLTLHDENGTEFLYITDYTLGEVYKTTLDGRVLFTIKNPKLIGQYGDCDQFRPTETCVGPNGDIYIADGYGSQYILQYTSKGEFIRKFGGDGWLDDKKFKQAHGVTIDNRDPNNPILMCTERMKNCFKRYTLDGAYLSSVYLPGAYMSRAVFDGDMLYSGVCYSALKHPVPSFNSGFVTILDKNNQVVSNPGGTKPRYQNGELQKMIQETPVFKHCHDICIDDDKNLYVCQWNANKTYPIKLERV
jgi:hypothetical protein